MCISRRSSHQYVIPGFSFPTVAPKGLIVRHLPVHRNNNEHRYYDPLRLPTAHPEVLCYSLVPQYLTSRADLFVSPKARLQVRHATYKRRALWYTGIAYVRLMGQDTIGPLQFPGYPSIHMPWPQIPVVFTHSPYHVSNYCLPAIAHCRLSPDFSELSSRTTTVHISELNTRPVNSLHPASDTTCW